MGMRRTWPGRSARVNAVSALSTRSQVDWQRYWRHSLRIRAPGRSLASQRIWKPLQEPSTRPPRATNSGSASTTGGPPRPGPRAEVVAVGEPARKDQAVEIGQVRLPVPDVAHRLMEHLADDVVEVAVTPRAGEDDHAEFHGAGCSSFRVTVSLYRAGGV